MPVQKLRVSFFSVYYYGPYEIAIKKKVGKK